MLLCIALVCSEGITAHAADNKGAGQTAVTVTEAYEAATELAENVPTEESSAEPIETPAATEKPSAEPEGTPVATEEPSAGPEETPIPTAEPTETPTVPIERPGKVSDITICYGKTNSRLVLTWKKAQNAEKYLLYRKTNDKAFRYVGETKKCRFVDKGIQANKKYKYKIVSYQSEAEHKENSKLSRWFSTKTIVSTKHQRYSYKG